MLVFILKPAAAAPQRFHFSKAICLLTLQSLHISELYHYAPLLERRMRVANEPTERQQDLEIKKPPRSASRSVATRARAKALAPNIDAFFAGIGGGAIGSLIKGSSPGDA
jgi:hypothetical protein